MASPPSISPLEEEEEEQPFMPTLSPISSLSSNATPSPASNAHLYTLSPSTDPSPVDRRSFDSASSSLLQLGHGTSPPFLPPLSDSNPGTPHLSRPHSARMSDRMKRFLRIPSAVSTGSAAGVATSSVQATSPSIVGESAASMVSMMGGEGEQIDGQASSRDRLSKMLHGLHHQITNPRSFRRPRRIRRKRSTVPERSHYSADDGYTSDPGLLRDEPKDLHDHDEEEEEEDTESGDPEAELRKVQIAHLETKLEKTKKLLQESEEALQETTNTYLQGMEATMNDKAQQKIRNRFLTRRPKAEYTISHLKKKVERYEQQLQILKEGGTMEHHGWIKERFSGMKNGIKARVPLPLWKKKAAKRLSDSAAIHLDEEDDDDDDEEAEEPENTIPQGDDESASFVVAGPSRLSGEQYDWHRQNCDFCRRERQSLSEALKRHEDAQAEFHSQLTILFNKLQDERDRTERLEGEFNTLTELHQHEVIELRSQLAQMERVSFSKTQDLEDTLDNCQSRLHKLEVQVSNSIDSREAVTVPVGMARRVFSPMLTVFLEMLAVLIKMTNSMGKRTTLALFLVLLILFVSFVSYLI